MKKTGAEKHGLKEDVVSVCIELCGKDFAKQIDSFDDPDKYPKDFVEEAIYFVSKLVNPEIVKKKFKPIIKKYKLKMVVA